MTGGCPDGDGHLKADSLDYRLYFANETQVVGQRGWRWCRDCQGLFFAGNATTGHCVNGRGGYGTRPGGHDYTGSEEYILWYDAPVEGRQGNWRWCSRCQGLFFAGNPRSGTCPVGGGHDGSGSKNYFLEIAAF